MVHPRKGSHLGLSGAALAGGGCEGPGTILTALSKESSGLERDGEKRSITLKSDTI